VAGAGVAVACALLWLLAVQIIASADQGRRNLDERTANRLGLAQQFIDAYLVDQLQAMRRQADASLTGAAPTAEEVARAAQGEQFRVAVLTDDHGRVIHTVPEGPGAVVGQDLSHYPALDRALAGQQAISSVVTSPLGGEQLVAAAVPFDTPQGRRVFAGGFVVGETPLGAFLHSSNVITGQRSFLVDANDVVVAGGEAGAGLRLDQQAPELAAASAGPGASRGSYTDRGVESVYFSVPMKAGPWRVVSSVPAAELYRPLERERAAPWVLFGAVAAASLLGIALLTGLLRQRSDLQRSNGELAALTGSLAHSEDQLRRVIDTAGDAFVAMGEDGAVTGWNAQAAATFGYAAGEAVGRPLHELIIPEGIRDAHVEGLARFLRTGEGPVLGQRLELEALRKGGEAFPVEVSIWAVAGRDGWDFNALIRDISERHRQQEALAEREELLRLTQEGAATGIALVALDGRWLQVNPALCAIVGRTAEEMLALTFEDVAYPADVDYRLLGRLLRGEIPDYEIEGRCVRPDGVLVWCQLHVSVLRGAGEDRLIFQVLDVDERHRHEERLAREVTDRLEAEQAARRERDFLAVVLAAVNEGYIYTVDGVIRDVNDRLCELTGFDRDELIGCARPYPFWPPESAARFVAAGAEMRDSGGGDMEVELVRRDGGRFPVALAIRPARGLDGGDDSFIGIVNDLTAIKQREGRLIDIAARDPLTGLFNRRAIDEHFARLRPGDALVVLDLDHFKRINDTFGHAAGDQALTGLAGCISANLRPGDWAGRLGGEEFILVVQAGGQDGATSVVTRLREAWAGSHPLTTFSAGIAVHAAGAEPRQTLAQADEAMYLAKHNGRNRTEVFTPADPGGATAPSGRWTRSGR
jgi:diguanylate cyclase (GGDEF)-like protein/PAS domain S-box-containing protein